MKTLKEYEICIGASVVGAALITPILVKLHFLHSFLVFSIVSQAENLFLLTALSLYAISNLILVWRQQHKLAVTAAGVAFYLVAVQGFAVIGLASLALLWVIPLCWYQFMDRQAIRI